MLTPPGNVNAHIQLQLIVKLIQVFPIKDLEHRIYYWQYTRSPA